MDIRIPFLFLTGFFYALELLASNALGTTTGHLLERDGGKSMQVLAEKEKSVIDHGVRVV